MNTDSGKRQPATAPTLNSWKEIAVYLGRGVRTVQRWQAELRLPVHRVRNSPRSPVFAYTTELDEWLRRQVGASNQVHIKNDEINGLKQQIRANHGARSKKTRNAELKPDDAIQNRLERPGFTFFITDIELAMTMVGIATHAGKDPEKKARNQENARRAYDAVLRLSTSAVLSDEERTEVDKKLRQLKSSLEGIGERF